MKKVKAADNNSKELNIHGHELTLTHLNKLFWKTEKYTKGDLIDYYEEVAPVILPYLKNRPLMLHRFPNGIEEDGFYQKNTEALPAWIEQVLIKHDNRDVNYLIVQNLETLLYIANLGCIALHPFHSQVNQLDFPDYSIFDLDPEAIDFKHVIRTANAIHSVLEGLKIPCFCKTSGGRGLHIYVPLGAKYTNEQSRQFAELIAQLTHEQLPDVTSLERLPKNRQGKVYIDYLQNGLGKTVVAPYSLRPKPGAPVSTPLDWDEVNDQLNPLDFNIETIKDRLNTMKDPFKGVLGKGIDLENVLKTLLKRKNET